MLLIDTSYFEGDIIMPDISGNADVYNNAIADYQDDYLRKVLSPSLYDAFISGLNSGNSFFSDQFSSQFVLSETLDERWDWIRNGHSYTINDKPFVWPGLVFEVNSLKRSPIASYVYSMYRKDNVTVFTSSGQAAGKSENSDSVSPIYKMVRVWNRMVDWNNSLGLMLATLTDDAGAKVYPEFDANYVQYTPGSRSLFSHQNTLNI